MAATSILINIGAQTAQAIKGITDVNKALQDNLTTSDKVKNGVKRMAVPAAAALTALTAAGMAAGAMASDQEQAFGALEAVYGKGAAAMQAWAKEQANIGLSAADAAQQASYLGSMLKGSGMNAAAAAKQSQDMVQLGADLAATYGGSAAEAVDALGAALRGEMDPLERYGASIKQSDINARMAAQGQDKLTGEAKKQAEQAARLGLIMEKTADAQGQSGREADTAAAAQARATAQVKNAGAELGNVLLPVFAAVGSALATMAKWAGDNAGVVQVLAVVIGVLAAAIVIANVALSAWSTITAVWSAVTTVATAVGSAFGAVMAFITSPIFLVIAAIVAAIAVVVLLWKNWDTVKGWLLAAWEAIKGAAVAVWGAISTAVTASWEWVKSAAATVWNAIKAALVTVWTVIKTLVTAYFEGYKAVITGVWNAVRTAATVAWNLVKAALVAVWTVIKNLVTAYFEGYKAVITGVWNAIKATATTIWNTIKSTLTGAWEAIKGSASRTFDAIKSAITSPMSAVKGVIEGVIGVLQRLWDKIMAVKDALASGLGKLGSIVGLGRSYSPSGGAPGPARFGGGGGGVAYTGDMAFARVVKRTLEGEDVRQGRAPGAPLAVAW